MKYRFGKPELTCVEIEKELGLARGDVREINTYPDGTIEIEVTKDLASTQKSKLKSFFELREKVIELP